MTGRIILICNENYFCNQEKWIKDSSLDSLFLSQKDLTDACQTGLALREVEIDEIYVSNSCQDRKIIAKILFAVNLEI
jgi:hypothetical protein